VYMGEVAELSRQLPILYKEARERGDLLLETYLGTNVAYLSYRAAHAPAIAYSVVQHATAGWPHERFDQQHHWALHASVECRLYDKNGVAAWELVSRHWPDLRNSLLMRAQLVRIRVRDFRARSALAAAIDSSGGSHRSAELVRIAECDAQKITRERIPG